MKSTSFALVYHDLCRLMRDARPFESSGERLIAPNPYVDDAKRWYCDHVGYADQAHACAACWLYDGCTIRTTKYGIGTARGIAVPAAAEAATGGGVSFHPTGSGSGDEVTLAGETGQAATERAEGGSSAGPAGAAEPPAIAPGPRQRPPRRGGDRGQRQATQPRSARFAELPPDQEYDL